MTKGFNNYLKEVKFNKVVHQLKCKQGTKSFKNNTSDSIKQAFKMVIKMHSVINGKESNNG